MKVLIFFLVFYVLLCASLYKVFERAGVEPWKALVPGLNFMEWCKLIGRGSMYWLLLFIPLVNIFIFAGMAVDLMRSHGKYDFGNAALAVIYAPIAFFKLAFKGDKYIGPTLIAEKEYAENMRIAEAENKTLELKKLQFNNPYKKTVVREWAEAIIFAVFAAAFIRMFFIEPYVIPTPSMEGSLLVGDFLFVSKAHYGMRMPQTILQVPLLHNRLPFFNRESYFEKPSLEYKRFKAIENIDRNDPVVFNYPAGDSVYIFPHRTYSSNDYLLGLMRPDDYDSIKSGRTRLVTRPVDKRDHYVKRCVGTPGDKFEIKERQIYINDQPAENPTYLQYQYLVESETPIDLADFSDWGISDAAAVGDIQVVPGSDNKVMNLFLNNEQIEKLKGKYPKIKIRPNANYRLNYTTVRVDKNKLNSLGIKPYEILSSGTNSFVLNLSKEKINSIKADSIPGISIKPYYRNPNEVFPNDAKNFPGWTKDDMGPFVIPQAGESVVITPKNIALYRRIIDVYEDNDLKIQNGKVLINGQPTTSYTFQQDYYWMMGDNRHNSEDSRFWGFVPMDHIVGKPLFIWFSTKDGSIFNGIRWNRIFKSASSM